MLKWTLYIHTFPNNKKYIGITKQNANRRWQLGKGYDKQPLMYNAIKKYGWGNIKHEIIFDDLTKEEVIKKEIEYIKINKTNNRNYGYNISAGGETGIENFKPLFGKDHHNSRKIKQLDLNGNILNYFDSQTEASKKLNINRKGITKNCLGESKTYKGFVFEYNDCEFVKPQKCGIGKHNNHFKRKIKEIDKDGNTLKTYNSIVEASKINNLQASGITKCCIGMLKTYHKRRWSYLVEMD